MKLYSDKEIKDYKKREKELLKTMSSKYLKKRINEQVKLMEMNMRMIQISTADIKECNEILAEREGEHEC